MDFLLKKRRKIDKIDKKLVNLLEKRFRVVYEVMNYKRARGLNVTDKSREVEVVKRFETSKLSKSFISKFFGLLFKEGKRK